MNQSFLVKHLPKAQTWIGIVAILVCLLSSQFAVASELFHKPLNSGPNNLRGIVDLHTHPMSHLGFGGKMFYGAPDIGIRMPAGSISCNQANPRDALNIIEALGNDYRVHGGYDLFKNPCGNLIRHLVVTELEKGRNGNQPHNIDNPDGPPSFSRWPKHNDVLHQMMWVDWLKRAYDGGLRVIVALSVNSMTLAKGVQADGNSEDRFSGDLQVDQMKRFAARHSWMEIVYSSADLRRVVGADKLAVILGVELDDIGSFVWNHRMHGTPIPDERTIRNEISRLYSRGVRYIFPVHIIDNYFGGSAVNDDGEFARANRYHFGSWWALTCAQPGDGISHRIGAGWDLAKIMVLGDAGTTQPLPTCPAGIGYVNTRGLQDRGRYALKEMMRHGMFIDIDHMSQQTVRGTLAYTTTYEYPLVSGHNSIRGGAPHDSEYSRTRAEYEELNRRSGIAGVGWADGNATQFRSVAESMASTGIPLAIGSDVNGFVAMPDSEPACRVTPCVVYSPTFPAPVLTGKVWNYNTDGVAHYGLLPDFLRHVETKPGGNLVVEKLFGGAQAMAVTWERAEQASRMVDWQNLGGTITSAPDCASWSDNRIDCFARGLDNALWHRWWDGTNWRGWERLGGVLTSAPTVASWGSNRLDVFARGQNNTLVHRWWNGSSWRGWEDLGGVLKGSPDCVSWGANRIDCFAMGENSVLVHKWWNGSAWSGWENLGGVLTSEPTAASWAAGRLDVFARGQNQALVHKWWNGSAWSGWENLGGVLTSEPDCVSWGANRIDCFASGQDSALWHRWWNGTAWSGWENLGGYLTSGPSASSRRVNSLDVFVRSSNGALWHTSWTGTRWTHR